MKKTLFTLFIAINLAFLYCLAVFALIKGEAAAAVDAQGKDTVSGNLFLWLLCAIAFLKVVTKLDGILHSLGIGVSRSPSSMLSEVLLAFRGFEIGQAFMGPGAAKAAAATTNTKTTPSNTFAGGLSGMVSRHVQQSMASSISGQTGDSTVETLKDYFTGTSDMDAMPIPATSENISTARAQHLYKTEVFAVNKYPICAALYTICIFICIYYILVCFLQKSQAISPGFFARKNLLYGYFPAALSLRHAGLLSSIPTITYRYDFTRPFCTVFHAPRRNTISFITSCCSFVK